MSSVGRYVFAYITYLVCIVFICSRRWWLHVAPFFFRALFFRFLFFAPSRKRNALGFSYFLGSLSFFPRFFLILGGLPLSAHGARRRISSNASRRMENRRGSFRASREIAEANRTLTAPRGIYMFPKTRNRNSNRNCERARRKNENWMRFKRG